MCVAEVDKDSPAEKAGLQTGAAVLELNGKKIASVRDYLRTLKGCKPGQKVKIKVQQGKESKEIVVELAEMSAR